MNTATGSFRGIAMEPRPFIQLWSLILILHGLLLALPHLSSRLANPPGGAADRDSHLAGDPLIELRGGTLLRDDIGGIDPDEMTEDCSREIAARSGDRGPNAPSGESILGSPASEAVRDSCTFQEGVLIRTEAPSVMPSGGAMPGSPGSFWWIESTLRLNPDESGLNK